MKKLGHRPSSSDLDYGDPVGEIARKIDELHAIYKKHNLEWPPHELVKAIADDARSRYQFDTPAEVVIRNRSNLFVV